MPCRLPSLIASRTNSLHWRLNLSLVCLARLLKTLRDFKGNVSRPLNFIFIFFQVYEAVRPTFYPMPNIRCDYYKGLQASHLKYCRNEIIHVVEYVRILVPILKVYPRHGEVLDSMPIRTVGDFIVESIHGSRRGSSETPTTVVLEKNGVQLISNHYWPGNRRLAELQGV